MTKKGRQSMRDRITEGLKEAMKGQDKRRMATLRLVNAAIKDRDLEARSQGKDRVSDDVLLELFAKMIKQREESSRVYEEGGRPELAEQEREEAEIIREFLPAQLSDDEVSEAITNAIAELDADGVRDMGRVMAHLKATYPGQMDFGKASGLVKDALQ